jgi:prepilin-type N-terminal cleavage/methylation domain-containing protein
MRCLTVRPTATRRRRGLTLVELLVSIALMLLIMSIIVAVFTAATGAMTTAKRDQELGSVARRLEGVIQQDLRGATARFTPPLDPADNLGYFEYGEGSFDDPQGEDTDDYLAFTVRAPVGQPFTGRVMLPRGVWQSGPLMNQTRYAPTTITSDTAEVIYFLRHGNLYRRVLLIVPNQQVYADLISPGGVTQFRFRNHAGGNSDGFSLSGANVPEVSWQGANDISVRPSTSLAPLNDAVPIPNSLGDLTNRQNRFARPGFANDLYGGALGSVTTGPDGTVDDFNGDGVADLYPSLYPNVFSLGYVNEALPFGNAYRTQLTGSNTADVLPFPFLFPGAYSDPLPNSNPARGLLHNGPNMRYTSSIDGSTRDVRNHSPLQTGDNLVGDSAVPEINWSPTGSGWTFWGFPTWAETRSIHWTPGFRPEFRIPAVRAVVAERPRRHPGLAPPPGRPPGPSRLLHPGDLVQRRCRQ